MTSERRGEIESKD